MMPKSKQSMKIVEEKPQKNLSGNHAHTSTESSIRSLEEVMTVSPAWSLVLIQGLLSASMGWFLLTRPLMTTIFFIQIMGLYWVISGIISIVQAVVNRDKSSSWGWTIVSGVIGVIAGMTVLNNQLFATLITTSFLLYIIAFAHIFDGIIKMLWGKQSIDRAGLERTWASFAIGLLNFLIGIALVTVPLLSGIKFLVAVAGWLSIFTGVAMTIASFQIRKYQDQLT